jgi:hypothetical protein
VGGYHCERGLGLLGGGEADQAHDACMRKASDYDELTKILVQRDQDPAFVPRLREDFLVGSSGVRIANPLRIDTLLAKLDERAAPDASVEEDSQLSFPTATGSTRSWATSRLA